MALAFFLSGAAALIYQSAWQRLLQALVGVDIESATLVVSVFMLGLGLGAAFGGWLADRQPQRLLLAFCLAEAGIATYGLASLPLLTQLAPWLGTPSRALTGLLCFALLLPPTLAMGATLPMLVAHAVRAGAGVGHSTGALYFINTLGAALGAAAMGFVLLHWLDLREVVRLAAALNLLASLVVGLSLRRSRR